MADVGRRTVDKATSLPSITIGFALLILGATWVGGAKFNAIESAIVAVEDAADTNRRRFDTYSGSEGANTVHLETHHEEIAALEARLALALYRLEQLEGR